MALIDSYRDQFGVEPICQVLGVAPSTYYAAKSRLISARRLRDEELKLEIVRVHEANFGVYGVEKVWRQLHREGIRVGRPVEPALPVEGVAPPPPPAPAISVRADGSLRNDDHRAFP